MVRLTDRLDITIAFTWTLTTNNQNNNNNKEMRIQMAKPHNTKLHRLGTTKNTIHMVRILIELAKLTLCLLHVHVTHSVDPLG